jgi:phospholipid/cholesterol/gamma-HCH transport system substrate-binding protein
MDYFRPGIKAGLVIIICLIFLFIMVFSIGNFKLSGNYNVYRVRFNFIGGLEKNAPVRFAGTEVGSVKDIKILQNEDKNIEVVLLVNKNATLRANSRAFINTLGMIGEKYVELTPGSKDAPVLASDTLIEGVDPTQMDELFKKGDEALAGINEILVENRQDLREMVANLKVASEEAEKFTQLIRRQPWRLLWKSTVTDEDEKKIKRILRKKNEASKQDNRQEEKQPEPEPGNKGLIFSD